MAQRPIPGRAPERAPQPKTAKPREERRWTFSFRYFRQHEHFGIGQQKIGWFASLLERLQVLSCETVADLFTDPGKKSQWRLHDINWNAKNVPIARADLDWIDKAYRENEAEFPFLQFQISKALGRVIGFIDENGDFNIVLLDPLHNAQPSNYNEYKIRETTIAGSHFDVVMRSIEEKIAGCGENCGCRQIYGELQATLTTEVEGHAMVVGMSEDVFVRASQCVSDGLARSMADLIKLGLDHVDQMK